MMSMVGSWNPPPSPQSIYENKSIVDPILFESKENIIYYLLFTPNKQYSFLTKTNHEIQVIVCDNNIFCSTLCLWFEFHLFYFLPHYGEKKEKEKEKQILIFW